MLRTVGLIALLHLFGVGQETVAQPLALSVRAGAMQASGQQTASPAVYPEVEVAASVGTLALGAVTFQSAAYGGYWHHKVNTTCRDCSRYASSNYVLGVRARFVAEKGRLPLTLSLGGARHILNADYASGAEVDGQAGKNVQRAFNTAEVGLGVIVPLLDTLRLSGEGLGFLPLRADEDDPGNAARYAFLVGVTYVL